MTNHSMQIFSNSDSAALAPLLLGAGMLSSKAAMALGVRAPLAAPAGPSPGLRAASAGVSDASGLGAVLDKLNDNIGKIGGGDTIHAQANFSGPVHSDVDLKTAGTVFAKTMNRTRRTRSSNS